MKERKPAAKKHGSNIAELFSAPKKHIESNPFFRVFQVQNPRDIRDGSRRLNPLTYLTFPSHPKSKREEPSIHIHSPAMFESPLPDPPTAPPWLHRCGRLAGPLFRRCARRGTSAVEIPPKLGEAASRWGTPWPRGSIRGHDLMTSDVLDDFCWGYPCD